MKLVVLLIFTFISINATINIQAQIKQTSNPTADLAFAQLEFTKNNIISGRKAKLYEALRMTNDSLVKAADIIEQDIARKHYIRIGLKFWKDYPNDPRRFKILESPWIRNVTNNWQDLEDGIRKFGIEKMRLNSFYLSYTIPLKITELDSIYPSMRAEYIQYYNDIPNPKKWQKEALHNFYTQELRAFIEANKNSTYRKNGKIDLDRLKKMIQNGAEYLKDKGDSTYMSHFLNALRYDLSNYQWLGLSNVDMREFVGSFKDDRNPLLRQWAAGKESFFALMDKERLKIRHKDIEGKMIDLDQLRGKVVLLDFWSLNCSGCIDRMPLIRNIYDKYGQQGFEVISVNVDPDKRLDEVKEVEKKVAASWPTLMIAGKATTAKEYSKSLLYKLSNKYSLKGVPQLLLLDKQGRLILHNHNLSTGRFPEELVEKLLKEPYPKNERR